MDIDSLKYVFSLGYGNFLNSKQSNLKYKMILFLILGLTNPVKINPKQSKPVTENSHIKAKGIKNDFIIGNFYGFSNNNLYILRMDYVFFFPGKNLSFPLLKII